MPPVFRVPNNEDGQAFIALMKKFMDPSLGFKRFGRGKRKGLPPEMLTKKTPNHEEVKVQHAESWAVYLIRK